MYGRRVKNLDKILDEIGDFGQHISCVPNDDVNNNDDNNDNSSSTTTK